MAIELQYAAIILFIKTSGKQLLGKNYLVNENLATKRQLYRSNENKSV